MALPRGTPRHRRSVRSIPLGLATTFTGFLLAWWLLGLDLNGAWVAILVFVTATIAGEIVMYLRHRGDG